MLYAEPIGNFDRKIMTATQMKAIVCIVGGIAALLVIGFMTYTPEKAAQYEKAERTEAICDQMMSDSKLGDERRATRKVCDMLKEKIKTERWPTTITKSQPELAAGKLTSMFVKIEPFTVNLQPENGDQYLQTTFTLQVASLAQVDLINLNMARVRSGLLLLLSDKKASELTSVGGKKKLSNEIIAVVQSVAGVEGKSVQVTDVSYTSFVIQ